MPVILIRSTIGLDIYFRIGLKSEGIKSVSQLLSALRYISHNPVKAKLVMQPADYTWSSL
jgi:hypothetical protein